MQTLEPYVGSGNSPRRPGRPRVGLVVLAVLLIAFSLLLIQTKVGVLIAAAALIVALVGLFAMRRGFEYTTIVAFLLHFEGLGRGGLSLGRGIAVSTVLLILYKLLVEGWRPPAIPTRFWLPVLGLVGWATASGAWGSETGRWFVGMGGLLVGVSFFLVGGLLVDSYAQIERFMRAFWWGGMVGAAVGLIGIVVGKRSWGLLGDANLFGLLEATMIPLTVYYRRQATTEKGKWFYTAALLLVVVGAAGAGSRSGAIGAAVAIFGTIVMRPGRSTGQRLFSIAWAATLAVAIGAAMVLLNPLAAQRGTDSSGRTDTWAVARELISERPLTGLGIAHLPKEIVSRLPETSRPSELLSDAREGVSSHNTWLDLGGDLGVVGVLLFTTVIGVTLLSFLRPRWAQTKDISGTFFVMMLPFLSSSMFLGMLNNKTAWSLIGLAAALQVPSWGQRYKGYFAPASSPSGGLWEASRLARWDLRVSQRFRAWIALGAVSGAMLFGIGISGAPSSRTATVEIFVPKLDGATAAGRIAIDHQRSQGIHTLAISNAYAAALIDISGVNRTVDEVRRSVSVHRPGAGPYLEITYSDRDAAVTEQIAPHMVAALDAVIEQGRAGSIDEVADELRPMVPGEQRYYTGPLFLPVSAQPELGVDVPRRRWMIFIGGLTGALVAVGFVLAQQRRPRVNNDDDFPGAVGMSLWTHVGRNGRRNAASSAQYAQVSITAFEATEGAEIPRRIVIAGPRTNRSVRTLAMGVAASLASRGERVVLVDGQVDRPLISWRLGGGLRAGMADLARGEAELDQAIRRVWRVAMPGPVRRTLGRSADNLRFVPAGRRKDPATVNPAVLDDLDADVVTVFLAPPLLGSVPAAPSLRWAEVVLYALVEGETVTFDAEDAAVQVLTFSRAPSGVVLADV